MFNLSKLWDDFKYSMGASKRIEQMPASTPKQITAKHEAIVAARNRRFGQPVKGSPESMTATRKEVVRLLHDATYGDQPYEVRMAEASQAHKKGTLSTMQYMQVADAINTHNQTGSYEGCMIWRNAENNPLG